MTRSASPNGQVEFSYDFPVASTSKLPPAPRHKRARSPQRPRWENTPTDDDDEAVDLDDEIDYDAYGYPYPAARTRRAHTHPAPTPTRNQWRAPSPPLYPFGQTTSSAYPYSAPLLLAPPAPHHTQLASSCESTCSMLSACSRASKEKKEPHKIRKARRSVDSDAPPSLAPPSFSSSPASSPGNSPYFSTYDDDFDADEEEQQDRHSAHSADDDAEEQHEGHAPSSLRRQWAALSLRVRFGVFRAKRRMRNRVMSL